MRRLILTDEEKEMVRLLEARGESENFIRGYIRAGRTFGFTKLSEEDIAMTKRKTSTDTTAPARKRKSRAKVKAAPAPAPVQATKAAPARKRVTVFDQALPIIVKAFKKLEDPRERPRGFGRAVMTTLMSELDVTLGAADQMYYKALWNHSQDLGL